MVDARNAVPAFDAETHPVRAKLTHPGIGLAPLEQVLLRNDTLAAGRDPASELEAYVLDQLVGAGPGAARRTQRPCHVVVHGHVNLGHLRVDVQGMGYGVVAAQRTHGIERAVLHAERAEDARLHGLIVALAELAPRGRHVPRDKARGRGEQIGVLVSLAELRGGLHLREGRDLHRRRDPRKLEGQF
jgi:hypothetical protein